jgi:hypothetical protein
MLSGVSQNVFYPVRSNNLSGIPRPSPTHMGRPRHARYEPLATCREAGHARSWQLFLNGMSVSEAVAGQLSRLVVAAPLPCVVAAPTPSASTSLPPPFPPPFPASSPTIKDGLLRSHHLTLLRNHLRRAHHYTPPQPP